jgi:hypothetical protein
MPKIDKSGRKAAGSASAALQKDCKKSVLFFDVSLH